MTRLWPRLSGVRFLAEVRNCSLVLKVQMTLQLTQACFERRGYRKSRAISLLHLWAFVTCYRVNFTFLTRNGEAVGRQVDHSSASSAEVQNVCKGEAIPLQVRTGPEGSRRLRLPDFKTIGT